MDQPDKRQSSAPAPSEQLSKKVPLQQGIKKPNSKVSRQHNVLLVACVGCSPAIESASKLPVPRGSDFVLPCRCAPLRAAQMVGGRKVLNEVLPKAGLVYSEKGNLSEVLCKPKIMPIKSVTLEKIEQMDKEMARANAGANASQ